MTISRIDLDGVGSPTAIAQRIHQLMPDLAPDFSIEALCRQFDIQDIQVASVTSFAAALIMHPDKAWGSIVVAEGTSSRRRRFSIGHELGHFLIPSHLPPSGEQFACSHEDLQFADTNERNRHLRIEAEANRFAANLLMPPQQIRANLTSRQPDLAEVILLADAYNVSKAAMARSYVDAHRETLALVVVRNGRIEQAHRPNDFPWIEPRIGGPVPFDSIVHAHKLLPGEITELEECDPETWLGASAARKVEVLSEQVLGQTNGWAMILLHAELADGG